MRLFLWMRLFAAFVGCEVFIELFRVDHLPAVAFQAVTEARPRFSAKFAKLFDCHVRAFGVRLLKFFAGHNEGILA